MALRYMRSMHSTSSVTCFRNTSETDCGSFDFGSANGVPLRPGDRLRVVPFMEAIVLHFHARWRSSHVYRAGAEPRWCLDSQVSLLMWGGRPRPRRTPW